MNEGFKPEYIDAFGGLVTRIDRSDLPNGLSPNCVNVEFFPGGYQSRVGMVVVATDASGYVNGIGSFMTSAGVRQRLYLYSNGTLKYATGDPTETQTSIETGLQNGQIMKTTVLFNRAYMAFSGVQASLGTAYGPLAHGRQWDGTYFDPVSQDGIPSYPILNAGAIGTKCTQGKHYVTMVCETRSGALCQPGQASGTITITLASDSYNFTSIPIGPANTIRRRMYLTPAVVNNTATAFYTVPALWVNDNSTTTLDADVSDAELLAGESLLGDATKNLPNVANVIPLPPVLSFGAYGNRLIGMAPLNSIPRQVVPNLKNGAGDNVIIGSVLGYANLEFTGGITGSLPFGWTFTAAGGALATLPGSTLWSYQITCDGGTYSATPYRGEIRNTYSGTRATVDYIGGAIYNYRVRLKKSAGFTGNFIIGLVGGASSTVAAASMATDWMWHSGQLFNATQTGTLFVGVSGATTNTQTVAVDAIEIYPATLPWQYARAYVSTKYAPEMFDVSTGVIDVNPGDGQGLRDGFELGGAYYWVKERSLWRSVDNGLEPLYWDGPTIVSPICGSPSVHGVAMGERWAIICGEQGVFKFDGGDPELISDEIRPTWKRINWDYGWQMWCEVDPENQRVYIGAPIDGATTGCNAMFVLDYSGPNGSGWADPISQPGAGRKWSLWSFTAVQGMTIGMRVERDNGRRNVVFGGGVSASQGFVVKQDLTGAAVVDNFGYGLSTLTSTYETATVGAEMGRSFFGLLVVKAGGTGTLRPYAVRPAGTAVALATGALSSGNHDLEFKTKNAVDTQTGVRLVVGASDSIGTGQGSIRVKRLALHRKDAVFSKFRGKNIPA